MINKTTQCTTFAKSKSICNCIKIQTKSDGDKAIVLNKFKTASFFVYSVMFRETSCFVLNRANTTARTVIEL